MKLFVKKYQRIIRIRFIRHCLRIFPCLSFASGVRALCSLDVGIRLLLLLLFMNLQFLGCSLKLVLCPERTKLLKAKIGGCFIAFAWDF